MESLLSISSVAQILGWIGLPILAGVTLFAVFVLSGGAERLINVIEDVPMRSTRRPNGIETAEETSAC